MTWNYDMDAAPKGETRKFTAKVKGKDVERTVTVKVPVIISTEKDVVLSVWSETRKQWSGVATDEPAIAWQPWPDVAAC